MGIETLLLLLIFVIIIVLAIMYNRDTYKTGANECDENVIDMTY